MGPAGAFPSIGGGGWLDFHSRPVTLPGVLRLDLGRSTPRPAGWWKSLDGEPLHSTSAAVQ